MDHRFFYLQSAELYTCIHTWKTIPISLSPINKCSHVYPTLPSDSYCRISFGPPWHHISVVHSKYWAEQDTRTAYVAWTVWVRSDQEQTLDSTVLYVLMCCDHVFLVLWITIVAVISTWEICKKYGVCVVRYGPGATYVTGHSSKWWFRC